jgi:hypothetical protein
LKPDSIRKHLSRFSIVQKRRTTIAHAFASSIAPVESYDLERVRFGLGLLGQSEDDIRCVYCNGPAETWDHLVGLVKNGKFSGYGHTVGNLVPSCRICNSAKGNKEWKPFLLSLSTRPDVDQVVEMLDAYQSQLGIPGITYEELKVLAPIEMADLERIQTEILQLMVEADVAAAQLQSAAYEQLRTKA